MKAQRILAIETTSPRLTLALGDGSKLVGTFEGATAWRHAEAVFEGMDLLLKKARWNTQSLSGVLVTTGPGSFTGIRIGLALARALAQFLKVPVAGVNSLQILAKPHLQKGRVVVSVIDALRGEFFTGAYDARGSALEKERRLSTAELDALVKRLKRNGDVQMVGANPLVFPEAKDLLPFAERLQTKTAFQYERLLPFYLREPAAIERRTGQR